jgi:hypothetical protein
LEQAGDFSEAFPETGRALGKAPKVAVLELKF